MNMVRATFDVISDVTFSEGRGFDRDPLHKAIDAYVAEAGRISLFDILGLPDWMPRPGRMVAGASMQQMKAAADQAIDTRRQTARAKALPDLLDLLMAGEDPETQRRMDTAELRDNLLTFIVAGHETTALTLAWALYLCAFDPEVQGRARAEAQRVLGDRAATGADVEALPLTRQIVEEALRLYPPAGIISRTAQACSRSPRRSAGAKAWRLSSRKCAGPWSTASARASSMSRCPICAPACATRSMVRAPAGPPSLPTRSGRAGWANPHSIIRPGRQNGWRPMRIS